MNTLTARFGRILLPTLVLSAAAGLLAAPLMLNRRASAPTRVSEATPPATSERALETYGRIPLSFEANRGQADDSVNFLARGAGYTLFLKPAEATFILSRQQAAPSSKFHTSKQSVGDAPINSGGEETPNASAVLRMKLVGADPSAAAEGVEELAGKVNYLIGDDPSRWRTDVPTFGRVRYAEVYKGVDLVYYGNQRQLEYDFLVAPGADPRVVSLSFEGADKIGLDASGDLLLTLGEAIVRQPKPFVYQEVAGARRAVEGGYEIGADGRVRFALGAYDRGLPLVIDPTLVYSTYLGGSGGDQGWGVAVDSAGNAYLAGFTTSTNFPTANAVQAANGGLPGRLRHQAQRRGHGLRLLDLPRRQRRRTGARHRRRLRRQRLRHRLHGLDELPRGQRRSRRRRAPATLRTSSSPSSTPRVTPSSTRPTSAATARSSSARASRSTPPATPT